MTCCMRRAKKVEKRYRRNAIHPLDIPIRDYVEKINKECMVCYHCKEMFNLRGNEIKINCAGCDKFFHCNIAGKCKCYLSWCNNCVLSNINNECRCPDCIN